MEKRILNWIETKKDVLFFLIISMLGFAARWAGKDVISGDMSGFLLDWFEEIRSGGGLSALGTQVGDYNIPYQVLIAILTYLPFEPVYMFKAVSVFSDFALALVSAGFVCALCDSACHETAGTGRAIFLFVYAAVLFVPTVILNSGYWGQCDSIYTVFAVGSLWLLYQRKYRRAFILLGFSFAFKMQAIFVLPFFIYYYFREKSFSILNFLWIPVVDYILCIPAFLAGRSLRAPVLIYLNQAGSEQKLVMNYPSFWRMFGNDSNSLKGTALILTIALLGMMLYLLMVRRSALAERDHFMAVLCWSAWTCVLFLPSMHERYGYMVDLLFLIFAAEQTVNAVTSVNCRLSVRTEDVIRTGSLDRWTLIRGWWPFFLTAFVSCGAYAVYLFNDTDANVPRTMLSLMNTAGYLVYSCMMLYRLLTEESSEPDCRS